MSANKKIQMLEEQVGLLEDEIARKRDNMREFVFQWMVKKYGKEGLERPAPSNPTEDDLRREAILDVFSDLYASWHLL